MCAVPQLLQECGSGVLAASADGEPAALCLGTRLPLMWQLSNQHTGAGSLAADCLVAKALS